MGEKVPAIVVMPPINGEVRENMQFNGFRCPECSGTGVRLESIGSGG